MTDIVQKVIAPSRLVIDGLLRKVKKDSKDLVESFEDMSSKCTARKLRVSDKHSNAVTAHPGAIKVFREMIKKQPNSKRSVPNSSQKRAPADRKSLDELVDADVWSFYQFLEEKKIADFDYFKRMPRDNPTKLLQRANRVFPLPEVGWKIFKGKTNTVSYITWSIELRAQANNTPFSADARENFLKTVLAKSVLRVTPGTSAGSKKTSKQPQGSKR